MTSKATETLDRSRDQEVEMASKANPNLTICTTCGAKLSAGPEYHPYAFCVLVKAGLNPLSVVLDAAKALGVGRQP